MEVYRKKKSGKWAKSRKGKARGLGRRTKEEIQSRIDVFTGVMNHYVTY